MSLRQLVAAASTIAVAVVLALGVPIAQLRTVSTRVECCCPDPTNCHCPHDKDRSTQPMMRACHKTQHDTVSPELPSFVVASATDPSPDRPAFATAPALTSPVPAPAPRRPDAPS